MKDKLILILFLLVGLFLSGCEKDEPSTSDSDLLDIPYAPIAFHPDIPESFPGMVQPPDNMMTTAGVSLGRELFYDPILSIDSTLSCSSCHVQEKNFTDQLPVSPGVDQTLGTRSSMSLIDIGFHQGGLFWDGRSSTLEELSLLPIEDPLEMKNTWSNVEEQLRKHPTYPQEFRKAFGINSRDEITRDLAAKAMAQFMRTFVSSGNAKFDRFFRGEIGMTEEEIDGYLMFFDLRPGELPDAECGHCHGAPLFTTNEFFNNGITESADFNGFPDLGLGVMSSDPTDNGKFKIPSLRNIAFSAPYMHDGRFQTLEEVVDHYNKGGKFSPNKHPLIGPLGLSEAQKQSIIAFLHTLTDTTFLKNPAFSNPHP